MLRGQKRWGDERVDKEEIKKKEKIKTLWIS